MTQVSKTSDLELVRVVYRDIGICTMNSQTIFLRLSPLLVSNRQCISVN